MYKGRSQSSLAKTNMIAINNFYWVRKQTLVPLFFAGWKGYESTVQILLNNWEHIDLWKKNWASPLFIASGKWTDID